MKILIIDDDRSCILLLKHILQHNGYDDILGASSASEGLMLAERESPDIILLDIVMPEIDGYTVCRKLKERKVTADIPVIMITGGGFDAADAIQQSFDAGAIDYTTKPIVSAELIARLKSALSLTAVRKKLRAELSRREEIEKELRISRERLETIFNTVLDGIIIVDPETRVIVDANPAALKMFQAQRKNIVGSICHDCICPTERNKCPVIDLGMQVEHAERILIRPDGSHIPVYKSVVMATFGDKKYLVETFINISDLKAAQEKLEKSETGYRTVVETAMDAIVTIDTRGKIIFWSSAAERMYGYTSEEICGKPYEIMLPEGLKEEAKKGFEKTLRNAIRPGTTWIFEVVHKKKGGEEFPVEVSPAAWKSGEDTFFTVIIRDITQRKQLEKERENLIARLEEALERVKTLKGLVPICASCKKIRDDKGFWNQIETYIETHTDAEFSHGLCPECIQKLYPELDDDQPA